MPGSSRLRRHLSAPIFVQGPLDTILCKTMPEDGAAVIKNKAAILSGSGSQPAADHLPEQDGGLRRPSHDDAPDVRRVEALSQDPAVGDNLDLSLRQLRQDGLALVCRSAGVQMLGKNAREAELIADMLGVSDIAAEGDGRLPIQKVRLLRRHAVR